jgi:hydroxymethylpyrimidine/phosphomethylpyrimidine kinase
MAACTVITHQNDDSFQGVQALTEEQVLAQLYPLVDRYSFRAIKIGALMEIPLLVTLAQFCQERLPGVPIIWDPVIRSSSGFTFLSDDQLRLLKRETLQALALITPNLSEVVRIGRAIGLQHESPKQFAEELSESVNVFLKDGHGEGNMITDTLWREGSETPFSRPRSMGKEKHGSGCVLSTAIAAYLARDFSLVEACRRAGSYTSDFVAHSDSRLGLHSAVLP